MKCIIQKSVLQNMLAKVQGFTDRKTTLPILSHVLLETYEGGLKVKATDLHTSIQVSTSCAVEEQGACAINCRSFFDLIRELPDDSLLLWTENHVRAHVVVGNFNTKLNIMDPEEYPMVEFHEKELGLTIDPSIIKNMIDKTIFSIPSTAESDTKYTLGGALLSYGEDEHSHIPYIEMVTTDSRRLSVVRSSIAEQIDVGQGIIVPRKGMQELRRLIEGGDEDATILLTKDSIYYTSTDTIATVRLIDGKFPDYRGIIKIETYPICTRINAADLLNALRVCSTMVSDIASCVKFLFKEGQTILYAQNPDQGDVEISLPCDHQGEEIETNFNPRYFIDCLAYIAGEAEIRLKGSQGPCLITPGEITESKWVIMPMRF
jgi:DNA polymerase-3 subunit beta